MYENSFSTFQFYREHIQYVVKKATHMHSFIYKYFTGILKADKVYYNLLDPSVLEISALK